MKRLVEELVAELEWIMVEAGEAPAGAIYAWEKRAWSLVNRAKQELANDRPVSP